MRRPRSDARLAVSKSVFSKSRVQESRLSWYLLKLVAQHPSVLSLVCLHSEPIRRRNDNQDVSSGGKRLQSAGGVKRSGLERSPGCLYPPFHLQPKFLHPLLDRFWGSIFWAADRRRTGTAGVIRRRLHGRRWECLRGRRRRRCLFYRSGRGLAGLLLFPPQFSFFLFFLLSFYSLSFHRLDGIKPVVDIFVFGAFNRTIGEMPNATEILNKYSINV